MCFSTVSHWLNILVHKIQLWDPRKPEPIREFKHHLDFISDFSYNASKKQLVSISGDSTVSVVDIRSNKSKPLAQSEDQEDELLSVVSIKRQVYKTKNSLYALLIHTRVVTNVMLSARKSGYSQYSTRRKDGLTASIEFQGDSFTAMIVDLDI